MLIPWVLLKIMNKQNSRVLESSPHMYTNYEHVNKSIALTSMIRKASIYLFVSN